MKKAEKRSKKHRKNVRTKAVPPEEKLIPPSKGAKGKKRS